jgi:hypothetical protein
MAEKKEKKEKRAPVGPEGSAALNELTYVLVNVSRNLWVGPIIDGVQTYTKDASEAAQFKRLAALDQFIEDCKREAGDYNVPVRVQDLVACQMGLDDIE